MQVTSIDSMKGDIIVMGSDGLFDNVFDHEIVSIIAEHKDVAETGNCFLKIFYHIRETSNLVSSVMNSFFFNISEGIG